jgi:hypothetical protein
MREHFHFGREQMSIRKRGVSNGPQNVDGANPSERLALLERARETAGQQGPNQPPAEPATELAELREEVRWGEELDQMRVTEIEQLRRRLEEAQEERDRWKLVAKTAQENSDYLIRRLREVAP